VTPSGGAAAIEHTEMQNDRNDTEETWRKCITKSDHPWSSATMRVTSSHRSILGLSHNRVPCSNKPPGSSHIIEGYKLRTKPNTSSRLKCGGTEIYGCNYFVEQIAHNDPCTHTERQRGNCIQNCAGQQVRYDTYRIVRSSRTTETNRNEHL